MACLLNPQLWVYIIVLIGLIAIARILIPWFISFFGIPAPLDQVLMIILWIVIACAGLYLLFELFNCIFSGGFPALPRPGR